jgi:hypothetical protein
MLRWLDSLSARRCSCFSEIFPSMTKRSFGHSPGRWPLFILRCDLEKRKDTVLTGSLLAFSLCAGAALLSRATFGAPFLLIAPVLALRLFRRNQVRNLAALFLPLGAAFFFYLFLTYARFGDFSGMPMRFSSQPGAAKVCGRSTGCFGLSVCLTVLRTISSCGVPNSKMSLHS